MKQIGFFIAKDYWGTQKAVESAKSLQNVMNLTETYTLFGDEVNCRSVIEMFKTSMNYLQNEDTIVYVIMVGHGNNIQDMNGDETSDGMDECYQLPDGNILDDMLVDLLPEPKNGNSNSLFVLISDHCSSGTMLDTNSKNESINWVNISSSRADEDSYTTGDGNVMTMCLISILKDSTRPITINRLTDLLMTRMNDFIGDLQHCCISYSNEKVKEMKICF